MLLKELNEEQMKMICDYMSLKCDYCPFGIQTGAGFSTCGCGLFGKELPAEFERIIKRR